MPETYRCPHCGAVSDVTYDNAVSRDTQADCDVCGKKLDARTGSNVPHYELKQMPDGTDV